MSVSHVEQDGEMAMFGLMGNSHHRLSGKPLRVHHPVNKPSILQRANHFYEDPEHHHLLLGTTSLDELYQLHKEIQPRQLCCSHGDLYPCVHGGSVGVITKQLQ